jgi:hypothetical protein
MNRLVLLLITATGASILAGCGDAEVVVHAQQLEAAEAGAAEGRALKDLPVRLLPYDRDALFDSLQAAHPVPEPAIPDTLLKLRDSMASAHAEWSQAEHRWGTVRDSLAKISKSLEGLSRTSGEYRLLFRDFQALEPQEQQARRQMDAAFSRFTKLQSEVNTQSDEVRLLRDNWADEVFAPVDQLIYARLKELGRKELADTTEATGLARFKAQPGEWWITARYDLPYEELYWNIPVTVQRGAPVEVKLTRDNAQVRPKL